VVGRVIIVGNTVTRDDVIRRALGLYPGQAVRPQELRQAAERLRQLGIFEVDPAKGSEPTVTAIPSEGDPNVQDVLVGVKETCTGRFKVEVGVNPQGGLILRMIVEERNFDACRLPTCWEDLCEGRAFRGAGRRLYLAVSIGAPAGSRP
jgi:outer membrane protein insertion porin family